MALTGLPFEDRIAKAADLGLRNVEFWFVDASYKGTPERLASLAQRNGVTITNTVVGAPDGSVGGGPHEPCLPRTVDRERARMTIAFTREAQIPATIGMAPATPFQAWRTRQ